MSKDYEESPIVDSHLLCGDCGKTNLARREDGTEFCFSCNENKGDSGITGKAKPKKEITINKSVSYPIKDNFRNTSAATIRRFNIEKGSLDFSGKTHTQSDGTPSQFRITYLNKDKSSFLARMVDSDMKRFITSNMPKEGALSGAYIFKDDPKYTGGKYITITEGAEDMYAVYEMMGDYPVVSLTSSATAVRDVKSEYDWLNSFDRIVLAFDNDEPGQKATEQVAALFDYNKVVRMDLAPYNDPCDWFMDGQAKAFTKRWWSAKTLSPEGIISSTEELLELSVKKLDVTGIPYPFKGMTDMTYGLRTGECVLLTAQEGIGKTEVMRAIEYHLLKTTDHSIGVLHFEEDPTRLLQGFASFELGYPVHLPESPATEEEIKTSLEPLIGNGRLHVYNHFGSNSLDTILARMRFLAKVCGCKFIFLDHISIIVSGSDDDGDERKALDKLSTQFAMLAQELDIGLVFVSHVNDDGKTRGSRNISKIAHTRFDLHRDADNEDENIANTTYIRCTKNRFGSKRGLASVVKFDPSTFTLVEQDVKEADKEKTINEFKKTIDNLSN